jgi:hypothetical protein
MTDGATFPLARTCSVVIFDESSASNLAGAIQTWLDAAGEVRLLAPIVARSDGSSWYATAFYSE